jgi:nitrile hydratase
MTWAACKASVRSSARSNEPVFHAPWEGRVITMVVAIAAWGKFGVDHRRYVRELIPPADFLA